MPMVGVIDPSHYERRHHKHGRLPRWLTIDEALAQAFQENPKWSNWPFELMNAVIGEHQERGDRLSVSLLTGGCPRSNVLERKEDYIANLDDQYASLRGTMVHRTLESYTRPGGIPEARFYVTVDGIELSCSPDLLTETTLTDYKVTENPPSYSYPYRHHTEQVQFNAFIARHAEKWDLPEGMTDLPFDPREHPARQVAVVYLGPKGPKILTTERKEVYVTPAGVEREGNRPYVWSDEEALEELRPRLHIMENALRDYPDWPEPWTDVETGKVWTAEEVWGGSPGWKCPGPPLCNLPADLAKSYPDGMWWENET